MKTIFLDSSQLIVSLFLDLTTEGGTCCVVESNGQDYRADVETDIEIDDVLRFDNANFSSPKSRLKSPIPQQRLHSSDDHKSFNTCQHEL